MTGGSVQVRLLGPVEAVRDGTALPLGGPRQRALLALLAVAKGRRVAAESLADELWHGCPPDGYRTTLRSYVSRLRRVLGESALESAHGSTYRLRLPPASVDADAFERLAREGDDALKAGSTAWARELFADALDLWRGPALAQVADDGLLRIEADRLDDLHLHVLEQRIEADIELGRSEQIVEEIESLVRSHPFRERLWRHLMRALYYSERQAEALEAYQRARRTLVDELGVEPSPRLGELEEAILRHAVAPVGARAPRQTLPAAVTSFIGRGAQLAELENLLADSRWVTLTGVGGVGKTRLALECARRAIPRFPGGVFFCDLGAIADPEHVPLAVASAVGVHEAGDPVAAAAASITNDETLVVLDNAEHVRGACADIVATLLAECAHLRVLVTSRVPLGAIGEVDWSVPPLALPASPGAGGSAGPASAGSARPAESVELFFARARSTYPRLVIDESAQAAAARICADLDGIPLAIELAAARAKMLSLAEIAENLSDRFRFLVSWRRFAPGRHQTLREAMDWSFTLLDDDERQAFARLSVFPAGFTLESAAGLCWDGDRLAAMALVERLGDASLVLADMRSPMTRYRMLETVRQYAADRLEEYGETEAMQEAHAREMCVFAEQTYEEQLDHIDRFAEDIGRRQADLRAALTWSSANDHEIMARLVKRVWQFWWIRGELAEGRAWIRSALRFADDVAPELTAEMLEGAAGLAWAQGDMDEAGERAAASLARYEALGDPRGIGAVLIILGHVALGHHEDFAAAKDYFTRAHQVQADNGLWAGAAIATHNLGSVAFGAGDLDEAERHYRDARAQYEAHEDPYGVAISDLYLGLAAVEAGRAEDAAASLGRALPVFREMQFVQYTAQCLEGAAAVSRARGDGPGAVRLLAAAESLRARTGESPSVAERLRRREVGESRAALGEEAFTAWWQEGWDLDEDEALDRAQELLGA